MEDTIQAIEVLKNRIALLEKHQRIWRWIVMAVFFAVIVFMLVWFAMEQGELESKNFTLVDSSGKQRAILGMSADGSPSLVFYDKDGKILVLLTTKADGSSGFELYDRDKRVLFKVP